VELTDSSSQLLQFSYGVFLGSLVSFFCLLNVIAYIITNYLLEKVDFEKKYPKIGKYINRLKKVTLFYICIDLLICLVWLLLLVFYSLIILSQLQTSV
jgi:predicted RND superfamily exporter protein